MTREATANPERDPAALGWGRTFLAVLIVFGVTLLDQSTKLWAGRALAGKPPVVVHENFFHLVYHQNAGGVFGILSGDATLGRRTFFILISLLALAFVVYLIKDWGRDRLSSLVGLSLIGGGAVGNLIDRVRYGKVIDFIDWHWHDLHWPTFNIADSAITCGTILLILSLLLHHGEGRPVPSD